VERDELGLLPGLERLQRTAYDWVLLLQDAFDNRRIHAALGIYSMHLLDENDTDVRERLADLEAWIQPDGTSATTPLAALVLVPSRNGAEPYVQSPGQHVTACRIPGPRDSVVDRGWTALGKCLDAFARWRRE
jgi:hypothetical protein